MTTTEEHQFENGWQHAEVNRPVDPRLKPGVSIPGLRAAPVPTASPAVVSAPAVEPATAPATSTAAPAEQAAAPSVTSTTEPAPSGLFAKIKAAMENNELHSEAEIEKLMHGG